MLCVLVFSAAGCPRLRGRFRGNNPPAGEEKTISAGGLDRTYLVHTPPGWDGKTPLPMIIMLHGGGGAAQGFDKASGMNAAADREKFIVVTPNGTGRFEDKLLTWNAGNCCGWALDNKVDDVAFISALIDKIKADYAVDPGAVFAAGMSNGGMMTYPLACALSDKIAGIADVSGAMNIPDCRPARPVSVIIFHGTADQHVLYNGGKPPKAVDRHDRTDNPVSHSVSFWTNADSCAGQPEKTTSGHVTTEIYENCTAGTGVTVNTIEGEGHTWPGGQKWAGFGDQPTKEISATDSMLAFFEKHKRK